jgi:hypothetical protein
MVHQILHGLFLRHRGETVIPFCLPPIGGRRCGERVVETFFASTRPTALRLDQGHGQLPLDVLLLPPMMNRLGRRQILAHEGFWACGTSINLGQNSSYPWCYL